MKKQKEIKDKICRICGFVIFDNDNYVRITDYNLGKLFDEGFYHTKCYNNKLTGANDQEYMKKLAYSTLIKANKLMKEMEA